MFVIGQIHADTDNERIAMIAMVLLQIIPERIQVGVANQSALDSNKIRIIT